MTRQTTLVYPKYKNLIYPKYKDFTPLCADCPNKDWCKDNTVVAFDIESTTLRPVFPCVVYRHKRLFVVVGFCKPALNDCEQGCRVCWKRLKDDIFFIGLFGLHTAATKRVLDEAPLI